MSEMKIWCLSMHLAEGVFQSFIQEGAFCERGMDSRRLYRIGWYPGMRRRGRSQFGGNLRD